MAQRVTWRHVAVTASDLFGDPLALRHMVGDAPETWRPPTDVFECDQAYVILLDISGLPREADGNLADAEVRVEDDAVVIRGNRRDLSPHCKRAFHQMEIHYGRFECRVRIHAPFRADGIRAQYRDGFLEVTVPKADPGQTGPRRIRVNE